MRIRTRFPAAIAGFTFLTAPAALAQQPQDSPSPVGIVQSIKACFEGMKPDHIETGEHVVNKEYSNPAGGWYERLKGPFYCTKSYSSMDQYVMKYECIYSQTTLHIRVRPETIDFFYVGSDGSKHEGNMTPHGHIQETTSWNTSSSSFISDANPLRPPLKITSGGEKLYGLCFETPAS